MPKPKTRTLSGAVKRRIEQAMQQGLALHQGGRMREAEILYRQVLAQQPAHPAANHLLGLARMQQGDAATAVELISRAVAQRPQDPQYHCNLGVALNASGQPERAIVSFSRAVELKPDYAEAWSNRGMALKAAGRPAEAAKCYRKAIALKPREAGFHFNHANALAAMGDLHEAEAAYRKALELRPEHPAALSGLSRTLQELGRPDDAVAAGEAAVARRPAEAEYHRDLGRAYRMAGRLEEAVSSYRQALAHDPADLEPYRLLSLTVRRSRYDDDIAAMERLYQDPALPPEQRIQLAFALGKSFDDLGEYDRSLHYYVEGNRQKRQTVSFSIDQARTDLGIISSLFDALPRTATRGGFEDYAPIFIVGLPRAGKTSIEGALRAHPRTYGAGELGLLAALVRELSIKYGLTSSAADLRRVPQEEFDVLGRRYAEVARGLGGASRVVIDTMPHNFRLIGFIRRALPNARIIHCVRDPLEHRIAIFQKYFAGLGYEYSYEPDELSEFYRLYKELMKLWEELFPGAVVDIDVGSVASDPAKHLPQIAAFCGLNWDDLPPLLPEPEPRLGDSDSQTSSGVSRLAVYRGLFGAIS
jgi:tetratricopeptide (TPR) repeat protein